MNATKSELQNFINKLINERDKTTDDTIRRDYYNSLIDGCLLTLDTLRVQYITKTEHYEYTYIEII